MKFVKTVFLTHYNELNLFLMGVAFSALLIIYDALRDGLFGICSLNPNPETSGSSGPYSEGRFTFAIILIFLLVVIGLLPQFPTFI